MVSRLSNIIANLIANVRDLAYNHSFKKFCMKNTLTNHEYSSYPSCKPSNERNTIICQENPPNKSCASLPRAKIPRQKTKVDLSQESELCYV
jgi:hypothetical protein